jgi:non-ribosomal peptide synthetase component F
LIENQVFPGDTIALAVDRSAELLISLLAIMKTGAAYVPVDPEYPHKRIEYMLEDSGASVLISSQKYKGQFTREGTQEIILEEIYPELINYPSRIQP